MVVPQKKALGGLPPLREEDEDNWSVAESEGSEFAIGRPEGARRMKFAFSPSSRGGIAEEGENSVASTPDRGSRTPQVLSDIMKAMDGWSAVR